MYLSRLSWPKLYGARTALLPGHAVPCMRPSQWLLHGPPLTCASARGHRQGSGRAGCRGLWETSCQHAACAHAHRWRVRAAPVQGINMLPIMVSGKQESHACHQECVAQALHRACCLRGHLLGLPHTPAACLSDCRRATAQHSSASSVSSACALLHLRPAASLLLQATL